MMMVFAAARNRNFASASCAEASSACSASTAIVIMGAMIMASIFVAIISIIGTIPYGWRGVQNG